MYYVVQNREGESDMIKLKLFQGDALNVLRRLPSGCVDLVVTSPPYWGTRSYLPSDSEFKKFEIGLEKHPKEYIMKICDVVEECMRILKKDGNMFLNIGDTWSTATHKGGYDRLNQQKNKTIEEGHRTDIRDRLNKSGENWLKEKQKLFIPYRVRLSCRKEGILLERI